MKDSHRITTAAQLSLGIHSLSHSVTYHAPMHPLSLYLLASNLTFTVINQQNWLTLQETIYLRPAEPVPWADNPLHPNPHTLDIPPTFPTPQTHSPVETVWFGPRSWCAILMAPAAELIRMRGTKKGDRRLSFPATMSSPASAISLVHDMPAPTLTPVLLCCSEVWGRHPASDKA